MTQPAPTSWTSRARLSYTSGEWLALAGPDTLVILQPASPQWSELINTIWDDVVAASSIDDLLQRMTTFRLEGMPNFAAFFWAPDGLRALVRGSIQVINDASGAVLSDGAGVQTWTESALAGVERIRVQLDRPSAELRLELPLIVGAAAVSGVVIDIGADQQVQAARACSQDRSEARTAEETSGSDDQGEEFTRPVERSEVAARPLPSADPVAPPSRPVPSSGATAMPPPADATGGLADDFDENVDGRTLLAPSLPGVPPSASGPDRPRTDPSSRPVVGILRPSSGGEVEVDRAILIGRSPSASRVSSDQLPRLLTVPSPSHDISRTHLQVAPGDGRVMVTDLNSTNGTVLIFGDGREVTMQPGAPVAVGFGTVIDLGDGVRITVDSPGRS